MIRLHSEYDRLIKQYTRLLTDEPECRVALEGVLRNVEVLQVAIGEIREQTLEAVDSEKSEHRKFIYTLASYVVNDETFLLSRR